MFQFFFFYSYILFPRACAQIFERHDNWSQYVASDNSKAKALCMKPVFALRGQKIWSIGVPKIISYDALLEIRGNALKFSIFLCF